MKIAFLGLGNMGGFMSRNLAGTGRDVVVFDVDPSRSAAAVAAGAVAAVSAAAAAADADVVITMLPTPTVVEEVLLGAGGVLAAMRPGSLWIDMSTSVPAVAERVRRLAEPAGIRVLDAPVSGMSKGAQAGTLQIFVGGDAADLEQARPLFDVMGDPDRVLHVGGAGAGYAVKLMINLLWFVQLVGIAEALTIGVKAGVELDVLRRSLVASPANSVLLERDLDGLLYDGDYDEGFAIALACKDIGLAVDLARTVQVPVETSAVVEQIFRRARASYGETAGEMTPVKLYEDIARVPLRLTRTDAVTAADVH
jgi:3-hydroxyisobutyrate dehydrogenase